MNSYFFKNISPQQFITSHKYHIYIKQINLMIDSISLKFVFSFKLLTYYYFLFNYLVVGFFVNIDNNDKKKELVNKFLVYQ